MNKHAPSGPPALAALPTAASRRTLRRNVAKRFRDSSFGVAIAPNAGDDYAWLESDFRQVNWSLSLIGFLAYIFVAITYQLGVADMGMAAALVGLVLQRRPIRIPTLVIGVGALYLWGWVTRSASPYPGVVVDELKTLGKLFLILLVAANVLRSRAEIRLYLILFLLFYAAYPARGTIFNYISGYRTFGRALWNFIYANPNDLAVITLLVLSMAAGVLVTERRKFFHLGAAVAVVVLTVVILMTKSRGAFLGLSVFGALTLLPQLKRARNVAISGAIVAGILILAPEGSFSRVGGLRNATSTANLADVDPEGSALQRYAIWRVSWAIIHDHPITGVGWGAYAQAHSQYSPKVDPTGISQGKRDTHSTYFNVVAEAGFPGAIIFGVITGSTLIYAERARRRCKATLPRAARQLLYLEAGLIGFLVAGIFGSYAKISFLYLHLALLHAVARACDDDMDRLRGGAQRALRAR